MMITEWMITLSLLLPDENSRTPVVIITDENFNKDESILSSKVMVFHNHIYSTSKLRK